ncbi:MAG: sulfatase-like hydrolase/transferase [bacterium]|nr:sulfatase-like hydrolase/transferase [bacterium]
MKNHIKNRTLGCSFLVVLTSTGAYSQKVPDKPNILIIITDQQSADAMSNRIGTEYLKTPNMDWLANHGITYTRAYCANPLSIPSRTSMFTGLYPHETGLQSNEKVKLNAEEFPLTGTIFHRAGYETGYVGKWHLPYNAADKDSHGFRYMAQIKNNGVDANIPEAALEFINQKHDRPFLLVTSFVNPHNICEWARGENLPDGNIGTPPPADKCPPLKSNHAPAKYESDIVSQLRINYQASPMFPVGNFSDSKWREYRWAYYRMVEKVDTLIGKILEGLRNAGLEKNTIIILLADHGDAQGAHSWNQKTIFFEEIVNIPFIISTPGMNKPQFCDRLIQTGTDLIPTLCDYAGISVPTGLSGISARKIFEERENTLNRKYVVVSDKPVQGVEVNGIDPKPDGRMVAGERFKYWIYSEGNQRESFFDIRNDPGEMINLATNPKYSKDLKEYRSYLRSWCEKYNDSFINYLPY